MGYITAEKISPSPLDVVGDLGKAMELERKMSTSRGKIPLKDALNKVIADFNKMITLKKHRVDSARRSMCYNLHLGYDFVVHVGFGAVHGFQAAVSRGSTGLAPCSLRCLQA